jgi:amino acid transporter
VGARTTYAAAAKLPALGWVSVWNDKTQSPRNAILLQGAISLLLVGLGAAYQGFQTLVDYTAPVYWLFLIASGLALFRLRQKEPDAARPFRVPLYPVVPALFVTVSSAMLLSAVLYVGAGAWFGAGVLMAGVAVILILKRPGG